MSAWLGWVGARGRQSWAAWERSRPAWVAATQGREKAQRGAGLGRWAMGKGRNGLAGKRMGWGAGPAGPEGGGGSE